MAKSKPGKSMNKTQIHKELEQFKTTSDKIKYLQSIEPRIKLANTSTKKAYYEALVDLARTKGDLPKIAEYSYKAGDIDTARRIWEKQGDVEMVYKEPVNARANYHKANALEKEQMAIKKQRDMSLEGFLNAVVVFGAFFCSFIFLSGSITGNTVLDANFKTSNLIGALLFIIGIVASFFYFERRKYKK